MTYFVFLTRSLACVWWGGQELEKAKAAVAVDQAKAKDAEASLLAAAAATEAAEARASELERALASERSRADSEASLKVAAEAKLAEVSPEVVELKSKVMCRVFSVFLSVCPSVFPLKSYLLSIADFAKDHFFHSCHRRHAPLAISHGILLTTSDYSSANLGSPRARIATAVCGRTRKNVC
jgi:hypothetical protein